MIVCISGVRLARVKTVGLSIKVNDVVISHYDRRWNFEGF